MKDTNIDCSNKILNFIIDICESQRPKYNKYILENASLANNDFLTKNLKKYFQTEEIITYKGKEQHIHDYKQFVDSDLFYQTLLDDFKLYICKILYKKKKFVLLFPDNYNYLIERIFNNNISFIYFYNFILFMKDISNRFPEIINESIYKIDLILIISIFSPDYSITFENGVKDKYGINYESFSILLLELIELIKEKRYEGYNNIVEIERHEFKYPKNWKFFLTQIESNILEFFFFKNYIIPRKYDDYLSFIYLSNIYEEVDLNTYHAQIKKIHKKFNENKKLDYDKINKILNKIIDNISKCKSFSDKKMAIREILDNKNINDDYKLLNENNILINLNILYELYSLDNNEINLQLIHSFDLIDNLEKTKNKFIFKPSKFLDFIKNRKKIILELKKANNYTDEFRDILNDPKFREKMKIILNSSVVKYYYKNPKYYSNNESEIIKLIGDKEFSEIYEDFLKKYIENNELYEKIIIKRIPFGIKNVITTYLCFILDPFGFDMNNHIEDKKYYIETYLIILFLHETNHFSKRCYYMNRPLSICKTPQNYDGGDSIIRSLFGVKKICIIKIELCKEVNNLNSWNLKSREEMKKFKKSLKNIIKSTYVKNTDEEKLIEIKNNQNCLICFSNYKDTNENESKISHSGSNNGFFIF